MRPNKYPYSKPQWEKEVSNIYVDNGYTIPYTTLVHYINRLTGEVRV
ncbi:Uncharacterised protein [Streptococcus pyogenes]|nr:hypothetical protein [Streptococcus pyogenes]AIG51038.1 hypothetical protein STAB901_04135 [Streptococcus pyogenes STAB901]EZK55482.1 hypothetical protein Z496_00286 [Streptococcus pyogenes ABC020054973]EZK58617.1 hypothetical protein Z492_00292 [Streptococcus pyogenes ABC020052558]EZK73165.1 hypothetical protein Z482_00292 [Streptococcus pyogenes ABC020047395]EZK76185.1 hypothetical protein Z461_00286 [Streptococcus pyogenes ABC020035427]EZK86098.1 hypothetical protein Z437_00287 [Strepto